MATMTAGSVHTASPRRRELAEFLRSRRERLTPEQVGLPPGRRRRTPGLRREEVAQLAAVGVSWYTWLEQGRDISASAQVLDAVARALRLDASERAHLFTLAGAVDPLPREFRFEVPESVRTILEQLEPFPASVQNLRYDLLAYNRTFGQLLCDLDRVPPGDRNCMWLAFTDADWRAALVEREATLELMVANFRNAGSAHFDEPQWSSMVDRLRAASPEFCELWNRYDVAAAVKPEKVFRNRIVGELRFAAERMWLQPEYGVRMTVFTPLDAATSARVAELRAAIG
jgi:transcriptional regulator with XRE-family HTH domain